MPVDQNERIEKRSALRLRQILKGVERERDKLRAERDAERGTRQEMSRQAEAYRLKAEAYKSALKRIAGQVVPEIQEGAGPEDMAHEAKGPLAAFGACLSIAVDALEAKAT